MKRIYLLLLAGGVLVTCLLTASGVLLKMGLSADSLSLGGVVLEDASVVWKNRLELRIGTLRLEAVGHDKAKGRGAEDGLRVLRAGLRIVRLFSSIQVEQVSSDTGTGFLEVLLQDNRAYSLTGGYEGLEVLAEVFADDDSVFVAVKKVSVAKYGIEAAGELRLDSRESRLEGSLGCDFGGDFPVNVTFTADSQGVRFKGAEGGTISNIKPFVDLFGLDSSIQRWITEYLSGSRYRLDFFEGELPWDNPAVILDTLRAGVRVENIEYTFAPGLEPLRGEYADVTFEAGVLYIKPHGARFYGHDGGESHLRIDFNDHDHILLVANIQVTGPADSDVALLLDYYGIPFPLEQVEGQTATDLVLTIDLNEVEVDVRGTFGIQDGRILHDGKIVHVRDTSLSLDNTVLTVEKMRYLAGNMLEANIGGRIDFGNRRSELTFVPAKVSVQIGESYLNLDRSKPSPVVRFRWRNGRSVLIAEETWWRLGAQQLLLGPFQAPVKLPDLSISLPDLSLTSPAGLEAGVKGVVSVDPFKLDLNWQMRKLEVRDLVLESTPFPFSVRYDEKLEVETSETADMRLNQIAVKVFPLLLEYGKDTLTAVHGRVSYGTFFDSYFSGTYNLEKKRGRIHLSKIEIEDDTLRRDLEADGETMVQIAGGDERFVLEFPEVSLSVTTGERKSWQATVSDLSELSGRSRFLGKLGVTGGNLQVTSPDGGRPFLFHGSLITPFDLFVRDGEEGRNRLDISGELGEKQTFFKVNSDLSGRYENGGLRLTAKGTEFDLRGILSLLEHVLAPEDKVGEKRHAPDTFSVSLTAEDGSILLQPKSRLLFDHLNLEYKDGKLSASLHHGEGQILLLSDLNRFDVSGRGLDDRFMGALIQESTFTGGNMTFSVSGEFDDFSAVIEIDKTSLKNFKTLSNTLAMLDTIPALATFSLPEYTTKGLPIDSAVTGMTVRDRQATFELIEVKSPVLSATGSGTADFSAGELDLDIKLTTQARRNMRKVPIIGYVVAGEEEDPSFNLKITGAFADPDVDYGMLSDIATIPYNVIYRTLNLPVHLFEKISDMVKE